MTLTIQEILQQEAELDKEDPTAVFQRDVSPEKQKLDRLRQISNVIQALENVVVQCEGAEGFEDYQHQAECALRELHPKLRMLIHL